METVAFIIPKSARVLAVHRYRSNAGREALILETQDPRVKLVVRELTLLDYPPGTGHVVSAIVPQDCPPFVAFSSEEAAKQTLADASGDTSQMVIRQYMVISTKDALKPSKGQNIKTN